MDPYHLPHHIVYKILNLLHLPDFVHYLQAFPLTVQVYGIRHLWVDRMDHRKSRFKPNMSSITWKWIFDNHKILQRYDLFIFVRKQGSLPLSNPFVQKYIQTKASSEPYKPSRQFAIWNIDFFKFHYPNRYVAYLSQISWEYF